MSAKLETLSQNLQKHFGDKLKTLTLALGGDHRGRRRRLHRHHENALHDEADLRFEELIDLCGVDYSAYGDGGGTKRFALPSPIFFVSNNWRLRCAFCRRRRVSRRRVGDRHLDQRQLVRARGLRSFGIAFRPQRPAPHPHRLRLHRSPLPQGFSISGNVEMRYDPDQARVIYQPVTIEPRENTRASCAKTPTGSRPWLISAISPSTSARSTRPPTACCASSRTGRRSRPAADPTSGSCTAPPKKLAETRTWVQSVPYMDRLDYVSMMCNEHAYCLAAEKLLGVEVPERGKYIRTMFDEVTRILNHLLWIGCHALDVGAMTMALYTFREREDLMDVWKRFRALACMPPITGRAGSIATCRTTCRNTRSSTWTSAKRPRN